MENEKKLTRSTDVVIAGVCGGLAEYFGLDKSLVRIAYALLGIFTGFFPFVLLYIIMIIIVPKK
jgi:phage shock protein PspC (stress-responsive transcriptional regulator)